MTESHRRQLLVGLRITSLGTLASRVLGLLRDMATAGLLGLAGGGVLDAFVVAFRIPNLFRRMFGEGALTASYIPVFARTWEQDRTAAWQLASVVFTWLAVALVILVLAAEAISAAAWWFFGEVGGVSLLLGLTATMLPYLLLICLAGQMAGTLHAIARFGAPAMMPIVVNVCWLAGAWFVAPKFAPDKQAQAYVLAVSILVAGVLQLALQWWTLRQLGFRFDYQWQASRRAFWNIAAPLVPAVLGLTATQINALADSLMAWGLAAPANGSAKIAWLGNAVSYPMQQGAAAAIYLGERMYHFPLGILGVAVATVIFPLLSRHAARGQRGRLSEDLTLGLQLVLFLGLPAGVGLFLLAEPIATLLFEHGQFTSQDTERVARMIKCYSVGVWAFCATPTLVRGFYALGDMRTPLKAAIVAMGVNLVLNLVLIWPMAEAGLAVATSLAAGLQVVLLVATFAHGAGPLGWRKLAATGAKTIAASVAMALAGYGTLGALGRAEGLGGELGRLLLPLAVCLAVFLAVGWLCRADELKLLAGGRTDESDESHPGS